MYWTKYCNCNKQTNEQKTLKNIKEKRNPKSEE